MTDDNNKNLNTESQTAAGTAADTDKNSDQVTNTDNSTGPVTASDTSTGKMPAAGPETDKQNKDLRFTETEDTTLEGALEALLFAMGDSVELSRLAAAVGRTSSQTEKALRSLQERLNRPESSIQLLNLDNSWQLSTKKQYYGQLITLARHPKKPQLTDVILETLSIIAYKQPVTKAQIEQIRGVSSEHAVNKLLEYDLIQELGRLNVPGRPILLGTTEKFLRYFGVESTDQLPELSPGQIEDFKAEAEAEADVRVDV
ncbi:MAG: SMC-Scp complex subunit ScpB [Bilifractor sp.]|nr:SMC-Scp complex subunit ScpB [Bilifractor sp.]